MTYELIPFTAFVGTLLLVRHFYRYSDTRTAYVTITRDDVRRGECGDPACCPAAIAMSRYFGVPCEAEANWLRVGEMSFPTPRKLRTWMLRYDEGESVGEIEFAIADAKLLLSYRERHVRTQPVAAAHYRANVAAATSLVSAISK